MSLTIRQLSILDAIVSAGSITGAAKKMFVSQPAVSKSLAALENQVGFIVFERSQNQIALTEKGAALHAETKRLLGIVEDFDGIIDDIRDRGAQRIRIATTQMISSSVFLSNALSEFCAAHPQVRLQLDAMSRQDVLRAVTSDRADVVIAYLPFTSEHVETQSFGHTRLLAVAKRGTWLADANLLSAKQISAMPTILLFERSRLRRIVDQYLYRAGETPFIRAEVATGAAVIELARAGIGVGLCDEMTLKSVDNTDLETRALDEELTLEIGFLRRLNGRKSEYQNQLENAISRHWETSFTNGLPNQ